MNQPVDRATFALALFIAAAGSAAAQPPLSGPPPGGGTLSFIGAEIPLAPVVTGAPFSAEASTQMQQTLGDGTHISRTTTGRLFRDGEGRVRREQTLVGLGTLDPTADGQTVVTIVDPVAGVRYVLDPARKMARRMATGASFEARQAQAQARRGAGMPPPPPPPPPPGAVVSDRGRQAGAPTVESLGTRQIEGVEAAGRKWAETIPIGRLGNDRPIEVTDERWESTTLRVLVLSRHTDPRGGDIEYRLTNIIRAEPAHDLFVVPAGYTIVDTPVPERHENW
jgi:hypothetical protein